MYTGQVYFDGSGNHQRHASYYWRNRSDYTPRKNFIFKDKLQLVSIRSNEARWKSLNTNNTYSSFIGDLVKFIGNMQNGIIEGFFTFRANGSYTSLIPTTFEFEDYTVKAKISGAMTINDKEGMKDFLAQLLRGS